MINIIQRMLYRLGIISPIAIITLMIRAFQIQRISNKIWIAFGLAVAITIYHILFIIICKRKLPQIDFNPESTPQEDDFTVIELSVSYLVPFAGLLLNNYCKSIPSYIIPGIECVAMFIVLSILNNTVPSPLYCLMGYHYHSVESNGKTYRLISRKKNFRNTNKVKKIKRLFDDLFILVE